jgi:hypothetical protein
MLLYLYFLTLLQLKETPQEIYTYCPRRRTHQWLSNPVRGLELYFWEINTSSLQSSWAMFSQCLLQDSPPALICTAKWSESDFGSHAKGILPYLKG